MSPADSSPAHRVPRRTPLPRAILQALGICVLSGVVGGAVNWASLRTGEFEPPTMVALHPWRILLEDVLSDYRDGRVLIVDGRSRQQYEAAHIAGAVYLDFSKFEEQIGPLSRWLPPNDLLVLVVPEGASQCYRHKRPLESVGYARIKCFTDPLSAWADAGGPIAKGWDMGPLLEARQ